MSPRIRYVRDEDGALRDEREFQQGYTKWCQGCGAELAVIAQLYGKGIYSPLCAACRASKKEQEK